MFGKIPLLVIIEEEDLRNMIDDYLSTQGFKVVTSGNIEGGVALAGRFRPRVILLDVNKPFVAISALKTTKRVENVPVFIFSGPESLGGEALMDHSGADDFIHKPYRPEKIIKNGKLTEIIKEKLQTFEHTKKTQYKSSETRSVLIIDDEDDIRRVVEYHLQRAGFSTITASDGSEGLKLARKYRPDLILLDVMMPGMSGLEVLEIWRFDDKIKNIPVFMLTAKTMMDDIEKAFARGATDYIVKPFEGRSLGNLIIKKLEKCQK